MRLFTWPPDGPEIPTLLIADGAYRARAYASSASQAGLWREAVARAWVSASGARGPAVPGLPPTPAAAIVACTDGPGAPVAPGAALDQVTAAVLRAWDDPRISLLTARALYDGTVAALASSGPSPPALEFVAAGADLALEAAPEPSSPGVLRPGPVIRPPGGGVPALAWRPDGRLLAGAGRDGRVPLWDATGAERSALAAGARPLTSVAWRPDGSQILAVREDGMIDFWDLPGGERHSVTGDEGRPATVAAWSLDGSRIAVGHADGLLALWGAPPDFPEPRSWRAAEAAITALAWNTRGTWLALGDASGNVGVWDVAGPKPVWRMPASVSPVRALAWSAGDRLAVSGAAGGAVLWLPGSSAAPVALALPPPGTLQTLAWSPDGTCLASAGPGAALTLWDTTTGLTLLQQHDHTTEARAVAWRADGARLATSSSGGTVRLYDVDLAALAALVARPRTGATRRALLIGVDASGFPGVGDLGGCVADALALGNWLIEQAGWPPDAIQYLLAPGRDAPPVPPEAHISTPTRGNILSALGSMPAGLAPDAEVCIYFGGHSTGVPDPQDPSGQVTALLPAAPPGVHTTGPVEAAAMVRKGDLLPLLARLTGAGARVTLILDTHNREGGIAGWAAEAGAGLVVAWAAHPAEIANETVLPGQSRPRGVFTTALITALEQTPPAAVTGLNWRALIARVARDVSARFPGQHPWVEGAADRPVFGGAWIPALAGYPVSADPASRILTVGAGLAQGIVAGDLLAIYPPDTVDFAAADAAGPRPLRARVTDAAPVVAPAELLEAGPVPDGSRARVLRPPSWPGPLAVSIAEAPPLLSETIERALLPWGAEVALVEERGAAVVVRAEHQDGRAGVALVVPAEAEEDSQVLAWAALPEADDKEGQESLGLRLAAGLLHWARAQAILGLPSSDPTLGDAVNLTVSAGSSASGLAPVAILVVGLRPDAEEQTGSRPDAEEWIGSVDETERLLFRADIDTDAPGPVQVAGLLGDGTGRVQVLVAQGLVPLRPGATAYLEENPAIIPASGTPGLVADPERALITLRPGPAPRRCLAKLFVAGTEAPRLDLGPLRIGATVQSVVDGPGPAAPPLPRPAFIAAVHDLPFVVEAANSPAPGRPGG